MSFKAQSIFSLSNLTLVHGTFRAVHAPILYGVDGFLRPGWLTAFMIVHIHGTYIRTLITIILSVQLEF